ncbi:MAG TPA: DUF2807 domain-containing protein, partial [Anaeromyxobacteraceae bacterium]|nr:DUF2807 domain-containing protein [Anaeromyxobacteraceae bacterium]
MRTLISLVLAAFFVPAWAAPQGDGSTTTQTREVRSFNAIKVETAADVAVKVGGPLRVAVTADPGLLQRVRTEVRGDTLVIDTKGDTRIDKPLRVEISVPELRKIEIDGSADATVEGGRGD